MRTVLSASAAVLLFTATFASGDTFGTGLNQFEVKFVTVSGDASSANGTNISQYSFEDSRHKVFSDPGTYRMGMYEITQGQWVKFVNSYGSVMGSPYGAYSSDAAYGTTKDYPTNNVSWYEALQFVNWLNTSTGHQAAYKFTGTIHTSNYTFTPWAVTDAGYNAANPYRNDNAFYFLPTEDEWVKAAYWNGTRLQTYATIGDYLPNTAEVNWGTALSIRKVGLGIQELNGTYDMMGNMWELMESPYYSGDYSLGSYACIRGGSTQGVANHITSSYHGFYYQHFYSLNACFRVASVPEPGTMGLVAVGAILLRKKAKGKREK